MFQPFSFRKFVYAVLVLGSGWCVSSCAHRPDSKPLRALLITGGCCHNYALQSAALTNAVGRHAAVAWTVVNEGGTGTRAEISLYEKADWAAGYDVVVHNECFADTKSPEYIRKITSAHHAGTPAVVIHCAMHTYRSAEVDDWREFLGVTSRRHDHQSNYPVRRVAAHPILNGMPENWVTAKDELYIIEKLWPNARALAVSRSEKDGKEHPVAWINRYGKARVFGTTYGHSDDTFRDPVFLNMVSRGLLWSAGRLQD
jgi:type 1 glutamine amidotransferase